MSTHDKYAELCALLAIGQLSASEDAELRAHLDTCPTCQATARDYAQIVTREMPLSSSRFRQWWQAPRVHAAANMREQFLRHARSEGVKFSPAVDHRPSFIASLGIPRLTRFYPAFIMLAVVIVATVVGWSFRPERINESTNARGAVLIRESALIKEVKDLKQANSALREEFSRSQEAKASQWRDLVAIQNQALTKDQRIDQLDRLLSSAQTKADALQASLTGATAKNNDFEARVNETARLLASARAEMEELRATRSDTDATSVAQQFQIKELSEKLRVQNASLDLDRQLLAASRDVSEMMGARNLYITDVRDFDTRGNPRKAFGRIFFTEGKSLVFYAFDLADRRVENVRHSFQAWGHQEMDPNSVKSLGIFYVDDKAQKRWVLKVDDPALLAHIDSVFVTVEPPGGEKKPTGQKLLYAYLNAPPNHP